MKKLIVLDRDGVINEDSDSYIKTPDEWNAIPESLRAIASLCQKGYHVVVVTNQSGISRGLYDLKTLDAIHQKMIRLVQEAGGHIDKIYICPHAPHDHCDCRKPKTGLLKQVEYDFGPLDWQKVIVVGDKLSDIEMARAVGAQGVLVKTGKGPCVLNKEIKRLAGVLVFDNLAQVVQHLV